MHQEVETTRSGGGGEFGRGEVILFFSEKKPPPPHLEFRRERERVVYRSGAARPFDSVVPGQQRRQRIGNNWIETVNGWGIGKGKKKKKSPFSPLCANRFDPSVRSGRIGTEQQEISDRRHTKRRRKTEQQPTNLFLNGSCLPLGRVQSSYISDKVAKLFVVLLLLLLEENSITATP